MTCCVSRSSGEGARLATVTPGQHALPERLVSIAAATVRTGTGEPLLRVDGEHLRRTVRLAPFRIDPLAVTVAWFAQFVAETGYRSDAERFGWSLVFHTRVPDSAHRGNAVQGTPWWIKVEGAYWDSPDGGKARPLSDHPVTHISWNDAQAFAQWAGGALPTEAQWEHAARGGAGDVRYPWGKDEPETLSELPANIWQGRFPNQPVGKVGTQPAGSFAPNGYGLYNMAGNVWEWTSEAFRFRSASSAARRVNDQSRVEQSKLIKGGSHLCHPSYCWRYRIAARSFATPDTSTGHMGFRLVF